MKLIPDWRKAWRFVSIQIAVIGGAMQAAVIAWPDFREWLGDTMSHLVGLFMFTGIIAGRVVKQRPHKDDE